MLREASLFLLALHLVNSSELFQFDKRHEIKTTDCASHFMLNVTAEKPETLVLNHRSIEGSISLHTRWVD